MNEQLAIELKNISLSNGGQLLLEIDHLTIYHWEKIGIIGDNGQGKSTLLQLLAGNTTNYSGEIKGGSQFKLFEQFGTKGANELLDGKLLSQLQLPKNATTTYSGGETTRLKLATIFSEYHEGLLLDEPTSHLDSEGITWLVEQLNSYYGTLLIVSHDRHFLDETVTKIWEIKDGRLTEYPGNYSAYEQQKTAQKIAYQNAYSKQTKEAQQLRRAKSRKEEQAQKLTKISPKQKARNIKPSRLAGSKQKNTAVKNIQKAAKAIGKRLEQLPQLEPEQTLRPISFGQSETVSLHNKFPVMASDLTLMKGAKSLLYKADFQFGLGKVIALEGPNGCGKSTLLQHIVSGGEGLLLSPKLKIATFEQTVRPLTDKATLMTYLTAQTMFSEGIVRSILHNLGFNHGDYQRPVAELSGGQQIKLRLAKLFLEESNLLILDEPTNFMDIATIKSLENFINAYQGTVLLASHDRYFVTSVATEKWLFKNQKLMLR